MVRVRTVLWNSIQLSVIVCTVMWCKTHFSLWVMVWKVGKALLYRSPPISTPFSSSQTSLQTLHFEGHCGFVPASETHHFKHSFLPEANWLMTGTLVPVYPMPATCTSPSPHTPPSTHHAHGSVAWGSSLARTLDALTIHVKVTQEPAIYTRPFCICGKTIINLIAISLQCHLLVAESHALKKSQGLPEGVKSEHCNRSTAQRMDIFQDFSRRLLTLASLTLFLMHPSLGIRYNSGIWSPAPLLGFSNKS